MRRMFLLLALLLAALAAAGCSTAKAPEPQAPVSVPAAEPAAPAEPAKAAPTAPPTAAPAPASEVLLDVEAFAWSPDGGRMALLKAGRVEVFDLQTGQAVPWPLPARQIVSFAGWKHDGSAVYVVTADYALLEVSQTASRELHASSAVEPGALVQYAPSPSAPLVVRHSGRKFQLIGGKGAWEGYFVGWSPTGRYLAYNDSAFLHLIEVATGKESLVGAAAYPMWHPGGEKMLVLSSGVEVWSVKGDSLVHLPRATHAAWSADGSRIVYQDKAGLWTINADGSNRQQLLGAPIEGLRYMDWLAHDEIVYSAAGVAAGGGTIGLITGGRTQPLDPDAQGFVVSPDKRRVAFVAAPWSSAVRSSGPLRFYPPLGP